MDAYINASPTTPDAPKKRLLFIVTQSEFGGAQRFLFEFISKLDRDRYDIAVATGVTGDASFSEAIRRLEVPVYLVKSLKRNEDMFHDLHAVWELRQLIKKTEPETLFLSSSKAGFIGALAARLCRPRPKVVYRIGGWTFNDPIPSWKKTFRISLERMGAAWKDIIIVNNEHDLEQAKELDIIPQEKVVLVHNGIDPFRIQFLPRDEARVRLSRAIPTSTGLSLENKKLIGTIANLYPTKGLQYLVEAATHISDSQAVVCIIGEGEERPKLQNLITKLGLEKKVLLLGRLADASQYLLGFDVFVLSSVKEGFPWSVLEAMSAKLPVVATRVGAISEVIDDGVNGHIVEPGNAQQLAEKINGILGNELAAHEIGIQAHQKILFSFTLDSMVKQTEQLL